MNNFITVIEKKNIHQFNYILFIIDLYKGYDQVQKVIFRVKSDKLKYDKRFDQTNQMIVP